MGLRLRIVSPEKVIFDGEIVSVTAPGVSGEFQILKDHAPLISCLDKGKVVYVDSEGQHEMTISSGFVEVNKNKVSLCVEL